MRQVLSCSMFPISEYQISSGCVINFVLISGQHLSIINKNPCCHGKSPGKIWFYVLKSFKVCSFASCRTFDGNQTMPAKLEIIKATKKTCRLCQPTGWRNTSPTLRLVMHQHPISKQTLTDWYIFRNSHCGEWYKQERARENCNRAMRIHTTDVRNNGRQNVSAGWLFQTVLPAQGSIYTCIIIHLVQGNSKCKIFGQNQKPSD